MSERPIKTIPVAVDGRKRPSVVRYFDWRRSDPNQYAGLDGLTDELTTYKENLARLLSRTEDYVLIKGREIIGIFSDPEEALAEALDRFQDQKVLIKKIVAREPIHSTGGAVT